MGGDRDEQRFAELVLAATGCRDCFQDGRVLAPYINVAQPRWVGRCYWKSPVRVVILMLNPGQSREDAGARAYLKVIRGFREGRTALRSILDGQRDSMRSWGNPPGRFTRFYIDGLGLSFDDVAFANVAWCATAKNAYPRWMLNNCFERHTGPLLEFLRPNVLVASGSPTHAFAGRVRDLLPTVTVIKALHYAHRAGAAVERQELVRLRGELTRAGVVLG